LGKIQEAIQPKWLALLARGQAGQYHKQQQRILSNHKGCFVKFQELQKFCLERGYAVKRVEKHYEWKRNVDSTCGVAETLIETHQEILRDIEHRM